jgi:hypothetical protein
LALWLFGWASFENEFSLVENIQLEIIFCIFIHELFFDQHAKKLTNDWQTKGRYFTLVWNNGFAFSIWLRDKIILTTRTQRINKLRDQGYKYVRCGSRKIVAGYFKNNAELK